MTDRQGLPVILENTKNDLNDHSEVSNIMIPAITQTYNSLIAHELIGVQAAQR
jgi:hypothetical protein